MNLQEFAALKEGDVIENRTSGTVSIGTVTSVEKFGVRVRWGDSPQAPTFFYSVQGTAWFHWSKVEPEATS